MLSFFSSHKVAPEPFIHTPKADFLESPPLKNLRSDSDLLRCELTRSNTEMLSSGDSTSSMGHYANFGELVLHKSFEANVERHLRNIVNVAKGDLANDLSHFITMKEDERSPQRTEPTSPVSFDNESVSLRIDRKELSIRKKVIDPNVSMEERLLIQETKYRNEIAVLRDSLERSKQAVMRLKEEADKAKKRMSDADNNIVVQKVVSHMSLLLACEEHEAETNHFKKETKAAIDALTIELKEKDMACIVAMMASERLQSQFDTERLEMKAKAAIVESEVLRSICGNVAHDLKTPLHTVMMGLESLRTLKEDEDKGSQTVELLDTLDSATAFMSSAISRAIDFTKASSGISLVPTLTAFNFESSIMCPIKWMNSMLPLDSLISIHLSPVPFDISTLISDKHWVEENLLCLLSNAVKYSNHGSVCIAVTLDNGMVRITVEDNGIGIPTESQSQLFKQFSQVQRMTVGGSGLGLFSLSKRSEAIGGTCGMYERTDNKQGSAFWFEFPYRPDTMVEVENKQAVVSACVEAQRSLRILLVDDSISVVKMLSKKLQVAGHFVCTAKNGAEGLSKMLSMQGRLDLVIMDLQMPVMDGIEATRRYRELELTENLEHIPIICSSANSNDDTQLKALAAGVDSFLPKPFNMETLKVALSNAMTVSTTTTTTILK